MKNKKRGFGYYLLFSIIMSLAWWMLLSIVDIVLTLNDNPIEIISSIRLVGSGLSLWFGWLIPFIINKSKQGK